MNWLREAITDSTTKAVSSKRVNMLLASVSLGAAIIILALAAYIGRQVDFAIGAVSASLAGLGGYGYVRGKSVELNRPPKQEG